MSGLKTRVKTGGKYKKCAMAKKDAESLIHFLSTNTFLKDLPAAKTFFDDVCFDRQLMNYFASTCKSGQSPKSFA